MSKRRHLGRRLSSGQEGSSELLEFALIVLPLALLLFGIIQYGFIFAAYTTIRNASVVAARFATVAIVTNLPANDPTSQIQAVATQAVKPMLDPTKATATVGLTNVTVGATNGATSVQVQYDLPLIIPWVVLGTNVSNRHITLSATTVMR